MQQGIKAHLEELLSENQVEVNLDDQDMGETEKSIREVGQRLLQAQQDLMAAQAAADKARQAETDANQAWQAKK